MAEIGTDMQFPAGLYVVATPIGNLSDISKRALNVLKAADIVACEDTRITGKLLNAFLIKKPMMTYHEHNGETQRPKITEAIKEGKVVALVSDAGTPLISDPGYKLVDALRTENLPVFAIPGPSAVTTALSVAGIPTNRFLFMGFAPQKSKARQEWFEKEKSTNASLVYYESAKRLAASLKDAAAVLGTRPAAVCRELTKRFEEVRRDDLCALATHYASADTPKGEIVVVIGSSNEEASADASETDALLSAALKHMSVKSASAFVAEVSGEPKKALYSRALELSGN